MASDEEYLQALQTLAKADRAKLDPLYAALVERWEEVLARQREKCKPMDDA